MDATAAQGLPNPPRLSDRAAPGVLKARVEKAEASSMGVVHNLHFPPSVLSGQSADCQSALAAPHAALFVRTQSSWLRLGLERAGDPTVVGLVLRTHEASHETWVTLIGALDAEAKCVAGLYVFHGRLVGFLERGLDCRLDPVVCSGIRSLLVARLRERTVEVERLLGQSV